jgi:hypothetical protein
MLYIIFYTYMYIPVYRFLSLLWQKSLKASHRYSYSGSSSSDNVNSVKVLWLVQFLSITIQPRLTIFGPHIDHGGYMSARYVTWPWPHFHCLLTLLNFGKFWWLGQFLQRRFTIICLHFDDDVGTVSWYVDSIYFLKNISHKQFAVGRRDIDLSTLVI